MSTPNEEARKRLMREDVVASDRLEEVLQAVPLLRLYSQLLDIHDPGFETRNAWVTQAAMDVLGQDSNDPFSEREQELIQAIRQVMSLIGEPDEWIHRPSDTWAQVQVKHRVKHSWADLLQQVQAEQKAYTVIYKQSRLLDEEPQQERSAKKRSSGTGGERPTEPRRRTAKEPEIAGTSNEAGQKITLATAIVGLMTAIATLASGTVARADPPQTPPIIIVEQDPDHQRDKANDDIDKDRLMLSLLQSKSIISSSERDTATRILAYAEFATKEVSEQRRLQLGKSRVKPAVQPTVTKATETYITTEPNTYKIVAADGLEAAVKIELPPPKIYGWEGTITSDELIYESDAEG